MSYAGVGASNKPLYDCCKYAQDLQQSVDPFAYQMYFGRGENCNKCIDKKVWFKQDPSLVNVESHLLNITRPLSDCDAYKYNPNCKPSAQCISTYDPNVPVILPPSLCPIVYNNIPKQSNVGYTVPNPNICQGNMHNTDVNSVRQFNKQLDINDTQDVHMFINSCNQKPLYNGQTKKVRAYSTNNYAPTNDMQYVTMATKGKLNNDTYDTKMNNNEHAPYSKNMNGMINMHPNYANRAI